MKKPIWQWVKGLWNTKAEPRSTIHNPLDIKLRKTHVSINLVEFNNTPLLILSLREYARKINGNDHWFVDYTLDGDHKFINRIRCYPDGQILLLSLYHEMLFNNELFNTLKGDTEFHITDDDNKIEEVYWRLRGKKDEEHCKVELDYGEGLEQKYEMDYWDFSRTTKDEANQDYEQFLFVEMDKDSGRFQMWRGKKIDRERITVL